MRSFSIALLILASNFVSADEKPVRKPENAVAALDVADGLEATLFAAEPLLLSPSNIDVDHLGRIWVCEVVNYRHFANKDNPAREAGDRILILEDTDGDGKADKETTFYQGRDIDSAHGVCVLGNRVIVSAGENVFNFYDDDGDLKADRKEVMFTGIKGVQHDHGIHSFTFGPDGRLYFNFGNNGNELHTPDGNLVVDVAGNEVIANRKPYQEGMAFRCELDGSKVDTLGWNFRNNWELCVDSFGAIWQSDNDDDGNKGVRINFVMEYGNYGYKDEFTGAGWREPRTGWEDTIPERHWHLNDPGVVPNLLQTGAGSPTGILIYEGNLLPKRFQNQLIHCDAGPNVVRSYAVSDDGAGYKAEINDILTGTRDQWFRPSDVCVEPDGSLIVADWYDPGVGGHRQGDIQRGRLFRVAPKGNTKYVSPKPDFSTVEGAAEALKSPNVATRYLAWQKLHAAGADAEAVLKKMFTDDNNPRFQARALWLLGQIDGKTQHYIDAAVKHGNSNIRIAGLRLARRTNTDVVGTVTKLVDDKSPQVRRECAVALRHIKSDRKAKLWTTLALQLPLPSHDRWYLEALGIGAHGDWDNCLETIWSEMRTRKSDRANIIVSDVVWRSRADESASRIAQHILHLAVGASLEESRPILLEYFRALDFQPKSNVATEVATLLKPGTLGRLRKDTAPLVIAESLQRLSSEDFASNPDAKAALQRALTDLKGTSQYIELVERFQLTDRYSDLLTLAQAHPNEQIGVEAIRALLRNKQWKLMTQALKGDDAQSAIATATVMGNSLDNAINGPLLAAVKDKALAIDVRRAAVRAASRVNGGAQKLAGLVEHKTLDPELTQTVAAALHAAPSRSTREMADRLFPLPAVKEGKPLPPISQLVSMKGDPVNGRLIFNTTGTCHKCHIVNKIGREFGPDLSEIGSKLSPQAMFESIIFPSAGISHNYEAYTLVTASGTTITGLITSETDDSISIKGDDALIRTFKLDEIDEKVKQTVSLMPADLQKVMTVQEIVDVVAYIQTLKKK
ncbi:PVC-type heme-binding CxxCH protein [Fuerstiella marisgermanici]|uniref:Putative membrane-bound dehydrogenase domain protein n=1 Tax=Fuerstiella marisgermanici TaxID=1891926 RepID=A0A1P8WS76_9PLAN|nr:PVC-type heme-binding CxxCH protein [Fuerstiella marisgermanici]APZ96903.1 putative membrane-bound dehydrogenase domain protein [Fuerstiella marisgermanici]